MLNGVALSHSQPGRVEKPENLTVSKMPPSTVTVFIICDEDVVRQHEVAAGSKFVPGDMDLDLPVREV